MFTTSQSRACKDTTAGKMLEQLSNSSRAVPSYRESCNVSLC